MHLMLQYFNMPYFIRHYATENVKCAIFCPAMITAKIGTELVMGLFPVRVSTWLGAVRVFAWYRFKCRLGLLFVLAK